MKDRKSSKLSLLLNSYLWLVSKTTRFEIKNIECYCENKVVGFWHEDSYAMNLVLKELAKQDFHIRVIVTADTRGDYIEDMIIKCGGSTIRLPDGFGTKPFLKTLIKEAKGECTMAAALDGPSGPRHVPKTLAFFLSEVGKKEFISVCFTYSRCLRLKKRWDHYVIPLPFTKITAVLYSYGKVKKEDTERISVILENSWDNDEKQKELCYNGGR